MNGSYSNPFITKIKLFIIRMFPPKAGKPNKGEQKVRYYGYSSNVSRGQWKKANEDELVPCILKPEESSKEYRENWARSTRLWRAYPEDRSLSQT
jgi:hypothetical protein